jgi:hypothetical protein
MLERSWCTISLLFLVSDFEKSETDTYLELLCGGKRTYTTR